MKMIESILKKIGLRAKFAKTCDLTVKGLTGIFRHTHDPRIGPDSSYHSHELKIGLCFRSQNNDGLSIVWNKNAENVIRKVLDGIFKRDNFNGTTIEQVGEIIINEVNRAIPRLKDKFNQQAFALHHASIDIDYDGSLDHPTGPVTFTVYAPEFQPA